MRRHRPPTCRRLRPLLVCAAALLLCCGCDRNVETRYAAVRGDSINGVSAFVQLLRDTGHVTTARQQLPGDIDDEYKTLVIFDESFETLDPEAAMVLERALAEKRVRTLLLVLRDGDAAIDYLRTLITRGDLSAERQRTAIERLQNAEQRVAEATRSRRLATPPFPDGLDPCDRPDSSHSATVRVRDIDIPDDSRDDALEARWQLRRRLVGAPACQIEWSGRVAGADATEDRLLVRTSHDDTEILVLASALPLLNGSLVDPGNRALAERLAALLPTDGRLLLAGSALVASSGDEGGAGGREPSAWRLLFVQPIPWLAVQTMLALAMFCWSTSPIFGRARRSTPGHTQDFGHHLTALGSLIARSPEGTAFSWRQLQLWHNLSARSLRARRSHVRR